MKITTQELMELAVLLHKQCGIVMDKTKDYLAESRLNPLLEEHALTSFGELIALARNSPKIVNTVVDMMTTNETSFFRDRRPFELIREKLLPDWLARQSADRAKLDIWSSACSTGQEVYSIAMVLTEFFKDKLYSHSIKIRATDISDSAITKASYGQYTEHDVGRGLNNAQIEKYFRKEGSAWKIIDELRSLVYFEKMNLLHSPPDRNTFDIIFCRNVAIYFSKADRQRLFDQISKLLKADGALIIGSTESLFGISERFERREHNDTAYYVLKG
jgi:chemotaxis protein methyltransferase CheR